MPLDERGKIAAAQLAFYAPVAGLTLYLVFRYALRRDAGWLFLALFSLSMSDVHYNLAISDPNVQQELQEAQSCLQPN